MTRFALTIEFDGQPFCGLQRQKNGNTVQQEIEDAAAEITGEKVTLFSAGRTDSGVHARAMVSHLDVGKDISAFRLMEALNAVMRPAPVAVIDCKEVSEDFHARFSCVGRSYEYLIRNRRAPLTFAKGREWQVARDLDAEAMHRAAQYLIGKHDFTTFRSVQCQALSPVKTLEKLNVKREGDLISIKAEAPSFLHHQVRSMVGTLAQVGFGAWPEIRVKEALEAKDRSALGLNAPPDGLYFMKAFYPEG